MEGIRQFIHDMIHMTEGEKFIAYWPLWLVILIFAIAISVIVRRKK